jgi:hypothetical protein
MRLSILLLLSPLLAAASFTAKETLHLSRAAEHALFVSEGGYGMAKGGVAELSLDSIFVQATKKELEGAGDDADGADADGLFGVYFMLRRYASPNAFAEEYEAAVSGNECMKTSKNADPETDIVLDASDVKTWETGQSVKKVIGEGEEGLYFLTFQRCKPMGSDSQHRVTFTFHHHL